MGNFSITLLKLWNGQLCLRSFELHFTQGHWTVQNDGIQPANFVSGHLSSILFEDSSSVPCTQDPPSKSYIFGEQTIKFIPEVNNIGEDIPIWDSIRSVHGLHFYAPLLTCNSTTSWKYFDLTFRRSKCNGNGINTRKSFSRMPKTNKWPIILHTLHGHITGPLLCRVRHF